MAKIGKALSGKAERSWLKRNGPGWALVFVGILVQVASGRFGSLECTRRLEQVACFHRTTVLGLLPLGERTIRVLRADVATDACGGDSGCGYRVELATTEGIVPLQSTWYTHEGTQEAKAQQINEFLASGQPHIRVGLHFREIIIALLPSLLWIGGVIALWSARGKR
jgi:hypothetical protein